MSALLDDIINLAINGQQPLPDILRMCLLLGHEIKNEALKAWANQELNGYDTGDTIPDYRIISGDAKGHFLGPFGRELKNYPLPSLVLEEQHREWALQVHLPQAVSAYSVAVHDPNLEILSFPWPNDLVLYYQRKFLPQYALISARLDVPVSAIVALLDNVRNRTLNIALQIKDELGTSYSDLRKIKSKEIEASIQSIVFQNTGGNTNVAFGQAHMNASEQGQINIVLGDRQSLDAILSNAGLSATDLKGLTAAMEDDGEKPNQNVNSWIKSNASK